MLAVYVVEPERYLGSREEDASTSSTGDVTRECVEKGRLSAIVVGGRGSCGSL